MNAIYVHFWLSKIENEILWNPIPDKYSDVVLDKLRQGMSLSFLAKTRKAKLWKLLTSIPLVSCSFQDIKSTRNYVNKNLEVVCRK